jgi:hypothetical protein
MLSRVVIILIYYRWYQLLLTLQSIKEIKTKDPLLDTKIEEICTGLQISYVNNLRSILLRHN